MYDHTAAEVIDARPFKSLEAFLDFRRSEGHRFSDDYVDEIASHVALHGIHCNIFEERGDPSRIQVERSNYRETLTYRGMNSRVRAMHHVFRTALGARYEDMTLRIYAPEAITPYALYLRGKYPKFLGSEYARDDEEKRAIFPIPAEDLHELSFDSESFDVVIANEVFEHVPFLDQALAEISRVLRVGGRLISTFPFRAHDTASLVKAELREGKVVHLMEPEYHGNPIDPEGGSLVFEIPGWDILRRVEDAGFIRAEMTWVQSALCGIIAPHFGGVMVLSATR